MHNALWWLQSSFHSELPAVPCVKWQLELYKKCPREDKISQHGTEVWFLYWPCKKILSRWFNCSDIVRLLKYNICTSPGNVYSLINRELTELINISVPVLVVSPTGSRPPSRNWNNEMPGDEELGFEAAVAALGECLVFPPVQLLL